MKKKVLILGATSKLCHETARLFAKKGYDFELVARNQEKLETVAADLKAYGASDVETTVVDFKDLGAVSEFAGSVTGADKKPSYILIGHGVLTDQAKAKEDESLLGEEIMVNFYSASLFLTKIKKWAETCPGLSIGVITSVAGDRGRQSNYVYGATKAGMSAFTDGYRAELARKGVRVTNIKPGPVRTPMTAGLEAGKGTMAEASDVGRDIFTAMEKGRKVLYTPFKWALIMFVIRLIPSFIFDRLKI